VEVKKRKHKCDRKGRLMKRYSTIIMMSKNAAKLMKTLDLVM
jgi:hypothetical protein